MSHIANIAILTLEDGVRISAHARQVFAAFEEHYVRVRDMEGRLLSIEAIRKLPYPDSCDRNYAEWKRRQKSIRRLVHYVHSKGKALRILDIGCGNGFMTHLLAGSMNRVVGVDVNLTELKQATEAFPDANISWYCLDLLQERLPEEAFDIIAFGASFQYFKNAPQILAVCKSMLAPQGEIHIIDSPFYTPGEKTRAQQSSLRYFQSMKAEEMTTHYHHHSYEALREFHPEIKYRPGSLVGKLFRVTDSPFPWIKIS